MNIYVWDDIEEKYVIGEAKEYLAVISPEGSLGYIFDTYNQAEQNSSFHIFKNQLEKIFIFEPKGNNYD